MDLKKYRSLAFISILINAVSVFAASFAIWTSILIIFSIFIVNNRDSEKLLRDKKIMGFIQAFMLCATVFIFTGFGISLFPLTQHLVQIYLSSFYYLFLSFGVIGLISYYYLFVKLLMEAIKVVKQKEI